MSCWVHKEASGLWQWPRQALFQELRGQRVFGLWGPLSSNFPQKCQTRTFSKLISNTWVRASFQTDLGREKRKDLDMHMTSAMGQRCGLPAGDQLSPFVWNGGASQNPKRTRRLPGKPGQGTLSFRETQSYFKLPATPGTSCLTSEFSTLVNWFPSPSITQTGTGSMCPALCHLQRAFPVGSSTKKEKPCFMQVRNWRDSLALNIELIEKKLSSDVFQVQNTLPKIWHFGILTSLSKSNLKKQ